MPEISRDHKDYTPQTLKPYQCNGVELSWNLENPQATGDCPFCGKEGKFSVNIERGVWRCLVCASGSSKGGGNIFTFLRHIHETATVHSPILDRLARDRKLQLSSLQEWGVRIHPITNQIIIPGYNAEGKLCNIYRYVTITDKKGKRKELRSTTGLDQQLFGLNFYDSKKSVVAIFEGPWDGIAYWELIQQAKLTDDVVEQTSNIDVSIYKDTNVLCVPGASTFFDKWCNLLDGKKVILGYDNDHEREVKGRVFRTGYDGMKRATGIISKSEATPSEILYVDWGGSSSTEGYDPDRKDGYDVRDLLTESYDPNTPSCDLGEQLQALDTFYGMLTNVPGGWIIGGVDGEGNINGYNVKMQPMECNNWRELISFWRKAFKWTTGLDRGFCCMLASVISTKTIGEPIWIRLISPPSSGKSSLCEAISIAKEFVIAKSTLTGFHSGYLSDRDGKEDNSLLAKLDGMTLVTKDGDTLLAMKNREQILSQARDIYDGTSRTHYGHGKGRDYEGFRLTWIVAGTQAMYQLDSSELGERFLTCKTMDHIDDNMEDDILWMVAHRSARNVSIEADGQGEGQYDKDMALAMQKTGGYVNYLRRNASELLSAIDTTEEALRHCISLGKLVAYMRARPSKKQEEMVEREFAARLVGQMTRLANCTAAVLNKNKLDNEVMWRVTQVALDTATGRTLDICKHLHEGREEGLSVAQLSMLTHHTDQSELKNLVFLRRLGVVQRFTPNNEKGENARQRWRLTPRLLALFDEVFKIQNFNIADTYI